MGMGGTLYKVMVSYKRLTKDSMLSYVETVELLPPQA